MDLSKSKKPACSSCHIKKTKCEGVEIMFDDYGYVPKLTDCKRCKKKGVKCIITIPHCAVCNKKFGNENDAGKKNDAIGLCQECKNARRLTIAISNIKRTISGLEQVIQILRMSPTPSNIQVISMLEEQKSALEQTIQMKDEAEYDELFGSFVDVPETSYEL
ncbi:15627_t:CDS:2 [Gigaspora margarita]|uniref:15627_t:CDS:1 n=1 Tax=Gigaspora margarita TaxID=4874 RepID=A0ABM8VXD2_GIGMA|nr:15627_t:CDS:2 [Gigaspora margarita]